MSSSGKSALGLIIRSGPYHQRSARSQLDVALAAAALEMPLRLYFLGDSVLQLLEKRELSAAKLPAGYRGWASLPGLTGVHAFAESSWLDHLGGPGSHFLLDLIPRPKSQMQSDWLHCSQVLTL